MLARRRMLLVLAAVPAIFLTSSLGQCALGEVLVSRVRRPEPKGTAPQSLTLTFGICKTGKLQITTDVRMEGLRVYLGEEYIGEVPLSTEVYAGRYPLKITKIRKVEEEEDEVIFTREISIKRTRTLSFLISYTLVDTLEGHEDVICSLSFSPDEETLVSSGGPRDNTIRVWDTTDWQETTVLAGDNTHNAAHSLIFSPNGEMLGAGFIRSDEMIKIYNTSGWRHRITFTSNSHYRSIYSLAFSPDGNLLSLLGMDHRNTKEDTVTVYNTSTWQKVARLKIPGRRSTDVKLLSFSPDGKTLISAGQDGVMGLWDTLTWRRLETIETGPIKKLSFSPGGKVLVAAYDKENLGIWDTGTWQLIKTIEIPGMSDLSFRPDGRILAMSTHGTPLVFMDTSDWQIIKILFGQRDSWVSATAFSSNGRTIACGHSNHDIKIWGLTLEEQLGKEAGSKRDLIGDIRLLISETKKKEKDNVDHDRGHGNDPGHFDPDNPGRGGQQPKTK